MLTNADKAWVGGLMTLVGGIAQKTGYGWLLSPELLSLAAGAVIYFVPNKAPKS